jgi:hypothetical protein
MTSFKCQRKAPVVEFELLAINRGYFLGWTVIGCGARHAAGRSRLRRPQSQKGIGGLALHRIPENPARRSASPKVALEFWMVFATTYARSEMALGSRPASTTSAISMPFSTSNPVRFPNTRLQTGRPAKDHGRIKDGPSCA